MFIFAIKKGILKVTNNMYIEGVIKDVLFSKELLQNLLSVELMQKAGLSVMFEQKGVEIYDNEK